MGMDAERYADDDVRVGMPPGRPTGPPHGPSPSEAAAGPGGDRARAAVFLVAIVVAVAAAFALTAALAVSRGKWRSAAWFINGEQNFTVRVLALSAFSGAVFGLVDNSLLHFSLDALGPYFPGGELTRAGWANTVSNGVGAFLGAFAAKAIQLTAGFEGGPLYGDAVGAAIGCIIGIYLPRIVTGRS